MMKHFTVMEDHLKLMRRAYVRWEDCEFGAPSIDCKRPYGNSAVLQDIAEILGEEPALCPYCHEPLEDSDEERFRRLHEETKTVLQIALVRGIFECGTFVCDEYKNNWRKA